MVTFRIVDQLNKISYDLCNVYISAIMIPVFGIYQFLLVKLWLMWVLQWHLLVLRSNLNLLQIWNSRILGWKLVGLGENCGFQLENKRMSVKLTDIFLKQVDFEFQSHWVKHETKHHLKEIVIL